MQTNIVLFVFYLPQQLIHEHRTSKFYYVLLLPKHPRGPLHELLNQQYHMQPTSERPEDF